jgi:ribosomal subunit interface protein
MIAQTRPEIAPHPRWLSGNFGSLQSLNRPQQKGELMDRPLELVFRNMKASKELKALVEERAERLEQIYQHIIGCRVTIELDNRRSGTIPDVHIDIQVPGRDLVVNQHSRGGDALTSVHNAFDAAAQQIREYKAKKIGHVKLHDGEAVTADLKES